MKLYWWNCDCPENGGKSSEGFFRFKTGGGPSKGWSGSTWSKNAGVLILDQEYTIKIWSLWLILYPQRWEHLYRLFGYPRHDLGAGFASSNTYWRPMHPHFVTPGYASNPPNQAGSELDGFHITILGKRYIAWREVRSWKSAQKSSSVLAVRG